MYDIMQSIYKSSVQDHIYGMGQTTINDILDFVQYALENIISQNELYIDIIELYVDNPDINDNPHKNADLQLTLYYAGDIAEDELYDIIHNEQYIDTLTYNKVYINITPKLSK